MVPVCDAMWSQVERGGAEWCQVVSYCVGWCHPSGIIYASSSPGPFQFQAALPSMYDVTCTQTCWAHISVRDMWSQTSLYYAHVAFRCSSKTCRSGSSCTQTTLHGLHHGSRSGKMTSQHGAGFRSLMCKRWWVFSDFCFLHRHRSQYLCHTVSLLRLWSLVGTICAYVHSL